MFGIAAAISELFGIAAAISELFGIAAAISELFGIAAAISELFGIAAATVPVTETCRFWNRTTAVERRKRCSLLGVFLQRRVGCTTVQRTDRFYGR